MDGMHKEGARINISELADIRDVTIDPAMPAEERRKSYLRQIKDPRLYRFGDRVVRVSFDENGGSLEDRLKQYLLSVQSLRL